MNKLLVTTTLLLGINFSGMAMPGLTLQMCPGGQICPGDIINANSQTLMAYQLPSPAPGHSSSYKRTLIVSPVLTAGGDIDANASGAALVSAIQSIAGQTSATNPYLIKVEPGSYQLTSGELVLPSYTKLEGAGQFLTQINAQSISTGQNNVVAGVTLSVSEATTISDTVEVTNSILNMPITVSNGSLTLSNVSSGNASIVMNGGSLLLTNTSLSATAAVPLTVSQHSASVVLHDSTVTANGLDAVDISAAVDHLHIENSTLLVNGGTPKSVALNVTAPVGADAEVRNSTISNVTGYAATLSSTAQINLVRNATVGNTQFVSNTSRCLDNYNASTLMLVGSGQAGVGQVCTSSSATPVSFKGATHEK